jgi:hypothetical protein
LSPCHASPDLGEIAQESAGEMLARANRSTIRIPGLTGLPLAVVCLCQFHF